MNSPDIINFHSDHESFSLCPCYSKLHPAYLTLLALSHLPPIMYSVSSLTASSASFETVRISVESSIATNADSTTSAAVNL